MRRMHAGICGQWLAMTTGVMTFTAMTCAAEPAPLCGSPASMPECDRPSAFAPAAATHPANAQPELEPVEIFQQVVDRYHRIVTYKDSVKMVQTTQRDGEEVLSVETKMSCEIADGKLSVETTASAIRRTLGMSAIDGAAPSMEKTRLKYDLWLAPHMALRFANQPLKELRAGVDEGFTATEAESVIVDNRRMLHVALKSGDGLSEDCAARFDFFINPESMLVERIESQQHMPDGVHCQTSLHITPLRFENEADAARPTT